MQLCWPEEVEASGSELRGYVMPRIQSEFYFDVKGRARERSLDWAVSVQKAFVIPFSVTGQDRLELVRLISRWLKSMHDHNLVYGDLSWKNVAFSVSPEIRVSIFDFDSTRLIGAPSFTGHGALHTIDWTDPAAVDGPPTLDSDRYRFAALAFRLLVSKDLRASIDPETVPRSLPGLHDTDVQRLTRLWRRACGPSGTRPTLVEWCSALDVPVN